MNIKTSFFLLFFTALSFSCQFKEEQKQSTQMTTEFQKEVVTDDYELNVLSEKINAVLVLFGGYNESIEDMKREFQILKLIEHYEVAVIYVNFNQHLWLETSEKEDLNQLLQNIYNTHQLPNDNIYFGGFSSGGNVSLLLSNYLIEKKSAYAPKGVFAIDSPIDLQALFNSAEKSYVNQNSDISAEEGEFLIRMLTEKLGNPSEDFSNYTAYSVFNAKTKNIDNIRSLNETKIRLYTEPDTSWWKANRMMDKDQLNAFYLNKMRRVLSKNGFERVEFIKSENKGYRANGERHPHSWSIVDPKDLMLWMLEEQNYSLK